jgi:hypothetical protein
MSCFATAGRLVWHGDLEDSSCRSLLTSIIWCCCYVSQVKTLDPDATVREGKTLQGHDHVDEDKLLQKLINLVRIGDLPRAQELCTTSGQPWRAVSLGGGTAWHDPQVGLQPRMPFWLF